MPRASRNLRSSATSVIVRLSAGIRISAIKISRRVRPSYRLEQKLQNLDVSFGVGEGVTPRIQPMSADQKRMSHGELSQQPANVPPEPSHVLIVLDNRNPLAMLVRRDLIEAFDHLVCRLLLEKNNHVAI